MTEGWLDHCERSESVPTEAKSTYNVSVKVTPNDDSCLVTVSLGVNERVVVTTTTTYRNSEQTYAEAAARSLRSAAETHLKLFADLIQAGSKFSNEKVE